MLCAIATFFRSALRSSAAASTKDSAPGSDDEQRSIAVPAAAAVQPPVGAGDQRDQRDGQDGEARRPGLHLMQRLRRDAAAGIDAEHQVDRRDRMPCGMSVFTPASEAMATASSPPEIQAAGMPSHQATAPPTALNASVTATRAAGFLVTPPSTGSVSFRASRRAAGSLQSGPPPCARSRAAGRARRLRRRCFPAPGRRRPGRRGRGRAARCPTHRPR